MVYTAESSPEIHRVKKQKVLPMVPGADLKDSKQFKRSYKACLSCRTRKIRCDLGSPNNPMDPPCARCRRERKDCVFAETRRGGSSRKRKESAETSPTVAAAQLPTKQQVRQLQQTANRELNNNEQQADASGHEDAERHRNSSAEVSTMQGALLFLANAAGTIAQADERDRLVRNKYQQETSASGAAAASFGDDIETMSPKIPLERSFSDLKPIIPMTNLTDFDYIGEGKLLRERDAVELVRFFFNYMHPFYPYIPPDLHDANTLTGYPILLCTVLTIASRYYSPEDNPEDAEEPRPESERAARISRRLETHERLWMHCQRLVSQSVWAEASTRSIGTVYSFLLFTEWNPRAIHWKWNDYANTNGPSTHADSLAGISAMRRSSRMSWMLCGTSIRLAQDMGFMGNSSRTFVATHLSETTIAMTIGQRGMLAQSLAEVNLNDDASFEDAYQVEDDMVLKGDEEALRMKTNTTLKFTFLQRANVELLKISSLAYETLYCGKSCAALDQKQVLAVLSILSPLLDSWEAKYKKLLAPKTIDPKVVSNIAHKAKHALELSKTQKAELGAIVDHESLRFDYYYTQLYIYSLALSNDNTLARKNLRLDELNKAAKYIELAFLASKEILASATRIHKLRMLRFMPVRWCTRIVRSVAFVVKCYMTLTSNISSNTYSSAIVGLSVIPTDDIIQTVQKAALALREASPDELHLATRYSTILMYLCSEMKSSAAAQIHSLLPKKKHHSDPPKQKNTSSDTNLDESLYKNNNNFTPEDSSVFSNYPNQYQNEISQQYNPQQAFHYLYNAVDQQLYNNTAPSNTPLGYPQYNPQYQPPPEYPANYFDSGLQNVFQSNSFIGLDFVDPFTELLEQQMRDSSTGKDTSKG